MFCGSDGGGAHLGAGFDVELLRDAALIGAERQVGHHQAGLALTNDFVQVEVGPLALGGQGVVAGLAQLHGNGIEAAGRGKTLDGLGAGP